MFLYSNRCLFYTVGRAAEMLTHQLVSILKASFFLHSLSGKSKKKKKNSFNFGIVSKCAHSPAVCYSVAGLMGHVSQLYNRVSRSGTIVWMVGVKGQALAALGITASVALQKRLLILCCLLCAQFYSPGASAFHWPLLVPQRGIRWAIETSQTPSAVIIHKLQPSRDSLSAIV